MAVPLHHQTFAEVKELQQDVDIATQEKRDLMNKYTALTIAVCTFEPSLSLWGAGG